MSETIQYFHDQVHGITYAVDVNFDKEDLIEKVHDFHRLTSLNVGISYVHPNDVYCKEIGRKISSSKMKPIMVQLYSVHKVTTENGEYDPNKLYITLADGDKLYKFRINTKSDKPHLIQVY